MGEPTEAGLVAELLNLYDTHGSDAQYVKIDHAARMAEPHEARWRQDAAAMTEAQARVAVLESALYDLYAAPHNPDGSLPDSQYWRVTNAAEVLTGTATPTVAADDAGVIERVQSVANRIALSLTWRGCDVVALIEAAIRGDKL